MPYDQYGNWVPGTNQAPWTPGNSTAGGGGAGCSCLSVVTTTPDDADGDDGDIRIDSVTGIIYERQSGAWVAIGNVGGGQIKSYSVNPNDENIVPDNQEAEAMAYAEGNDGPTYYWDKVAHTWMGA